MAIEIEYKKKNPTISMVVVAHLDGAPTLNTSPTELEGFDGVS